MKKILSILACVCVLLSVMVVGTVSAAETTANEIVLTVDSLGLASQSYSSTTATVDEVGFEWVQLGNYGDGIQVRDKNGNTSTMWNTSAFPSAIKEIKLTYSSTKDVSYANADAEIFSFGNAAGTYDYSTKLSTTAGVKEYTITPDAETYTFFKFEHDLGYTMYWDSITIVLVADDTTGGDDDDDDDTTGGTEIPATLAEQIAAANGLANGAYLPYESTITGTIEGTVSASNYTEGSYKFTVSDGTNSILCYYVPVTGGEPQTGDTITVTGALTAYNGAAQFDDTATAVLADDTTGDDDDDTTGGTEIPATLAEQIAQANGLANGEKLPYESTITGTIVGDVVASSRTEGAYKFTVDDGTNSILCYYVPVTGGEPQTGDTITVTGNLSAYNGAAQFAEDNATATLANDNTGDDDDDTTGDDDDDTTGDDDDDTTGDNDTTSGVVDTVEAGKAYKFGMVQGNLNDGNVYYLTGEMNGYYMATTTDAAAAIDVYLEETTGGYYLYTTDGTTKTYINMVVSGTHVNGAYEAAASTVYTFDATAKTLVAEVNGAPYWFGTRNDREYTTVGPCATEYDGFYAQFYAVADDNTGDDDNTGSNDDSNKEENKPSSPVTGDTTNVLFVALGVISVAAILLFASKKRALN